MNYLLIDLSYFNFYRFYATKQWYTNAHPEEEFEPGYDWSQNIIFMEKFQKMFLTHIAKYQKKFNIQRTYILKDCPRDNIWRVKLYPNYKGTRKVMYQKTQFMGGHVFKKCYSDILPLILSQTTELLYIPQLEADDLIYMTATRLASLDTTGNINIISSDHDLLQIIDGRETIKLYTANLKCYNHKSLGDKEIDCFSKAILGDPSDNIPKVFKRLGVKTMLKLYNDPALLQSKFTENPGSFRQYCLNRTLVDFQNIPQSYYSQFDEIFTPNINDALSLGSVN